MLLNCGVGEDAWESLGLWGDQITQSKRKSVLNIHRKDWCWIWNSNTLATWCEELTHWKRPWCWERLRWEEKGTTQDEMVGWHHLLHGHEFEQAPGVGDRQGGLECCSPWGRKELDTTEQLNWTNHGTTECFLSSTSYHITKGLFLEFFYPVQHAQVSKINKQKMYSKSKKQKTIVRRQRASKHQSQTQI